MEGKKRSQSLSKTEEGEEKKGGIAPAVAVDGPILILKSSLPRLIARVRGKGGDASEHQEAHEKRGKKKGGR